MAQNQSPSKHIIIAGDTPVRLFLYPSDTVSNPNSHIQRPRVHWSRVGTRLLSELLEEGLKGTSPQVHIHGPKTENPEHGTVHSILELGAYLPGESSRPQTFKMHRMQQIGTEREWYFPELPGAVRNPSNTSLLIFQETKTEDLVSQKSVDSAITLLKSCQPRFLIYHMAYRLCKGDIWNTVLHGPPNAYDLERLIIIVDANDLRSEGIELSHGLSWEKTCEDFVERIGSVGRLVSLATCPHLIVRFECAGAIYHRGAQMAKPILFFDPLSVEGEFCRRNSGYIPGVSDAFVAGFTTGLIQSSGLSIDEGINRGLHTTRQLVAGGLAMPGAISSSAATPLANVYQAAKVLRTPEKSKLIRFEIPSDNIARGSDPNWSLLDYMVGDPAEVARQIVRKGALSPGNQVPLAQFEDLILFDRREIESFRTIYIFLEEYILTPMRRPLCIALFGLKGSGKAFAAFQVAKAVSKGKNPINLRFNLSQFTSVQDLVVAFHSIRDSSLSGSMPFVYFNGFDNSLAGSPLGWLPHLLPVMFSGSFSDHGINRPIGSAVFFFGATSIKMYKDLRKIARPATSDEKNGHRAQEFLACLHGFVDILGPNKIDHGDEADRLYPVRRAVILRTLLENREPNLMAGEEINIDEKVLNALLLVPTYRQGIRSLKSIIDMSTLNGRYHFDLSSLPPSVQLDLHVDYNIFVKYLNGTPLPNQLQEKLAEALHNIWREKTKTTSGQENKGWNEVPEEYKESSRAHANSIPSKLREIQCFLSESEEGRTPIKEFTAEQIEHLAKLEHDRWNTERLQNQWGQGKERDAQSRRSPFLIPWGDLKEEVQDIDRALVRSYIQILPESHKIYKFGLRE